MFASLLTPTVALSPESLQQRRREGQTVPALAPLGVTGGEGRRQRREGGRQSGEEDNTGQGYEEVGRGGPDAGRKSPCPSGIPQTLPGPLGRHLCRSWGAGSRDGDRKPCPRGGFFLIKGQ